MQSLCVKNLNEYEDFVLQLVDKVGPKRLILLSGEMGTGKTQWVKYFLRYHGVERETASPSFALHHNYKSYDVLIDHVDLYRLETMEDLESTGFWDLFDREEGLIIVEWADRLPYDYYPPNWPQLKIELKRVEGQETQRDILFSLED